MIRINPTKILIGGNKKAAKGFIGPAKSQLEILKNQMSFQNLSQGVRRLWLNENTYIECIKCFNYQECKIWVRPIVSEDKLESLIDYILIVSTQSEQEAFAWSLIDNTILTDEDGNPMVVDTLSNVKNFVLNYIKRTDNFNLVSSSNDEINLIELEPSGSYYESWWKADPLDTINCESYNGYANVDEWNATVSVWPEYNQIDYNKKELSDCVNEENTKVSDIHHPVYYTGIIPGFDPAFDYSNASVTAPQITLYQPEGIDTPFAEWMTPYIEYTNHETDKEEDQESAGIIEKYGQYIPSSVPDEIKALRCGLPVPDPADEPASYVRNFFWFASVFGTNIHTYEGSNIVATQTDLDAYTDILYNTWDNDCYGVIEENPDGLGDVCVAATVPFCSFGLAENNNGAIVYDFCAIAWGYSNDSLTEDQKYHGALSGNYSQIFRLYKHPVGSLEGYALAVFNAHNEIREREGLDKFSSNIHLTEAAQRHAEDLALNSMTGHIGSDGSTWEERIQDTDYFLWVNDYYYTGENANNVDLDEDDVVDVTMTEWENSPIHWVNMISEDFTEIGIGVATGTYSGKPFIWFVVNFGDIQNKWPGFAQVDTTDILEYMNTNFTWLGGEDHIRVPKLFLV